MKKALGWAGLGLACALGPGVGLACSDSGWQHYSSSIGSLQHGEGAAPAECTAAHSVSARKAGGRGGKRRGCSPGLAVGHGCAGLQVSAAGGCHVPAAAPETLGSGVRANLCLAVPASA